jgi:Protein of unknown function TPD sequence-motif
MIKVPYNIEKKVYNKIYKKIGFGKIKKKYRIKLEKLYPDLNIKLIKSLRSQYVNDLIIKNFHKVKFNIISQEYEKVLITDLAKKYVLPPVILLRIIFGKKNFSSILNKENPNLTSYDKEQIDLAIKHDAFSIVDNQKKLEHSLLFEKKIEKILKKHNIKYKTQDDLSDEQIKEHGHAISTPDFLLVDSNLYINNIKINWIDAKNFYGANTDFIKKKTRKQIEKYIRLYGTGCIVFNLGISDKLNFNNAIAIFYDDFKREIASLSSLRSQ